MPRFVIHIGPHKTGSSYLQNALAALAEPLRAHGVLYPTDLGGKGHALLPTLLADGSAHPRLAAQLDAYAQTDCHTVILTSEELGRLHLTEITALRAMLGDHPAQIVFYCRAWGDGCASHWNQLVRAGFATPFVDAIRNAMAQPMQANAINYGTKLSRWAEVFDRSALHLVALESLATAKLDSVEHFAATFLGIPALPAHDPFSLRRNRSASPVDAEFIRVMNAMHLERTGRRDSMLARHFFKRRTALSIEHTLKQARACRDTLPFDERAAPLMELHTALFATYGMHLVPPHANDRFFTPRLHELPFVRPDYLGDAAVRAELQESYRILSA